MKLLLHMRKYIQWNFLFFALQLNQSNHLIHVVNDAISVWYLHSTISYALTQSVSHRHKPCRYENRDPKAVTEPLKELLANFQPEIFVTARGISIAADQTERSSKRGSEAEVTVVHLTAIGGALRARLQTARNDVRVSLLSDTLLTSDRNGRSCSHERVPSHLARRCN